MLNDRTSLHLALFAAALTIALFAWVEISLRAMESDGAPRATARTVAPGLSIAVHGAAPVSVRNLALNSEAP